MTNLTHFSPLRSVFVGVKAVCKAEFTGEVAVAYRPTWLCVRLCLAAFLILGTLGCGKSPHIRPVRPDSVILAFGDSLTSGVDGQTPYPEHLKQILGCEVVNAGIPGEVSADGARRLPGILDRTPATLVILCHGGNDLLQSYPLTELQKNLSTMISTIKHRGMDVILVAPPRPALLLKAPPLYRELAESFAIPCDPVTVPRLLASPAMKADQIHPNTAGNAALAQSIADLIRKSSR